MRQAVAPKLFLGVYTPTFPRTLIGYANATLASSPTFTADSMRVHDPTGTSVCVHGVVVAEPHRRTGIASALLKEYIRRLQEDAAVGSSHAECVLLICHENLIPLYTKIGFALQRKSPVVHGPQPWFELRIELRSSIHMKDFRQQEAVPPDVLAALTNPSRNRPVSRLFSSFPSTHSLITASGENVFDILCPRTGCGSIILKAGVAKFQHGTSVEARAPSIYLDYF